MLQLGKSLLAAPSREAVADATVHGVLRVVPAHHVSLIVFDREAGQATVAGAFSAGHRVQGSRWDRDAFGPIESFASGRPVVFADLASAPELPPALGAVARAGIRSIVQVPVLVNGEVAGLIVAGGPDPGWAVSADVDTLAAAAELVGPALSSAGSVEEAAQRSARAERRAAALERTVEDHKTLLSQVAMSQEQERQRLAVDIHDDSVQVMTVVSMRMEALRDRLPDEEVRGRLDEIQQTVRLATSRLRYLMFELLPPTLEREGLGPALSLYLERVRRDTGLTYVFESRVHGHAPSETRTALFRIAQEAVRNTVEHAGASHLEVLLDRREGGVWIRVSDDGRGFSLEDVESRLPMHLGLTAMRQHAELASGWCRVKSVPGGGTTVEAWVPGEAVATPPLGLSLTPA